METTVKVPTTREEVMELGKVVLRHRLQRAMMGEGNKKGRQRLVFVGTESQEERVWESLKGVEFK